MTVTPADTPRIRLEKSLRGLLTELDMLPAAAVGYKHGDRRIVSTAASAWCEEDGVYRIYALTVIVGYEKYGASLTRLATFKHTLPAMNRLEEINKKVAAEQLSMAAHLHLWAQRIAMTGQRI